MRYFLTGGTGFVGGELARQLRQAGHEVVAVVRSPEKAYKLKALGVVVVKGDVTDKESMRVAMQGCDGVYHVAGWYEVGSRHPEQGKAININGTRNVGALMQELNIQKGVYTSTLAINSDTKGKAPDESFHFTGTHISEYDRSKAAAHDVAKAFIQAGLPLVVLMPGLIYGPEGNSLSDQALKDYLQKKLPLIPSVAAYAWAHVEDVAHAHILAMERAAAGSVYMVCGPNHTLVEAIQIANSITGYKMPMVVSPGLLKGLSKVMGIFDSWLPVPQRYHSEALRVQAGVTYLGDASKAKRELGFAPRPLEEGLRQTFAAWS